jgi:hypothetical protein
MESLVGKWWPVVAFAFAVATIASVSFTTVTPPGPAVEQVVSQAR